MGFETARQEGDRDVRPDVVEAASADQQAAARAQSDEINQAAGNTAINDHLPEGVSLEQVGAHFTLPKGLILSKGGNAEMRTDHASRVNLSVEADELVLWFSPGVHIDATWPAENMTLYTVRWNFRTGQPSVDVRAAGWGLMDYTGTAETTIGEKLSAALAGTPAGQAGYDPFADRDLQGTIAAIAGNLQAMPAGPANDQAPGAEDLQRVGANATLKLANGFVHPGGLRVDAGGAFRVSVEGQGSVGDIMGGEGAQGRAKAAQISGVRVSSESVFITHDGEDVAQIKSLWVAPGGAVSIQQMELKGKAAGMSGLEALVRIIGGAAALSGRGLNDRAALELAARSPNASPTIVPGLTKDKIEEGLTQAVQQLLEENATAIPGMDLRAVFGGP